MKIFGMRCGRYIQYVLINCFEIEKNIDTSGAKIITNIDDIDYKVLGIQYDSMVHLLKNKCDLFVYLEDNKPLGMMCGYRGSCYIRGPGISIIQQEDIIYWFWAYTLPEARGKNIYKKLKNVFFTYYSDVVGFTALVDPKNKIMRDEVEKIGFKELKRYFYLNCKNRSILLERDNSLVNLRLNSNELGLTEI